MLPDLLYCALVPYVGHRTAERAVREAAERTAAADAEDAADEADAAAPSSDS